MASSYVFGDNHLRDMMISEIMIDEYEKPVDLHSSIIEKCVAMIRGIYKSVDVPEFEKYIDFEFDVDKEQKSIKLIPFNIVSALWFSGVFPLDCRKVYLDNYFVKNNIYYIFDPKKKKLIIKQKYNAKK